jgi:hypothetical protein
MTSLTARFGCRKRIFEVERGVGEETTDEGKIKRRNARLETVVVFQ